MGSLDGKVVAVSGVGPGLGRSIALAAGREGASVVLMARDGDRLAEVAAELDALGADSLVAPTDVTHRDQCEATLAAAVERFGAVHCLVNSAFRPDRGVTFEQADLDHWRKVHEVNVWGTLRLTQAAVPHLRRAAAGEVGAASVVFVSSMVVRKAMPAQGGYATSKGALLVAARVLARELAPEIRVNSVVPGWMWGPSVQTYVDWVSADEGISEDEVVARLAADIPQGRIPPQEDCAEAVVFLASDGARSITGQTLDVNGGEVLT